MAFIGNRDVDRIVLLNLDDSDLVNISQTNRYFRFLCSDEIWRIKTLERFDYYLGGDTKIIQYMKEYGFVTWKSYYFSLKNFLEGKYLGRHTSIEKRKDLITLDNYIDKNTNRLLEDINNFLRNEEDEEDETIDIIIDSYRNDRLLEEFLDAKEEFTIDKKSLEIFMDEALDDDMLNPNVIFENLVENFFNSETSYKISEFAESILEYMLNCKDKRIHPEYRYNDLLDKLLRFEDTQKGEGKLFKMVLKDPRVDPNHVTSSISHLVISKEIANLIFFDPRVKLDDIYLVMDAFIRSETDPVDLIPVFEAFLNKGAPLFRVIDMLNKIRNYNKRDSKILRHYVEEYCLKMGIIKQRPLPRYWYDPLYK
jgi:hypothetical protein